MSLILPHGNGHGWSTHSISLNYCRRAVPEAGAGTRHCSLTTGTISVLSSLTPHRTDISCCRKPEASLASLPRTPGLISPCPLCIFPSPDWRSGRWVEAKSGEPRRQHMRTHRLREEQLLSKETARPRILCSPCKLECRFTWDSPAFE